MAVTRKLKHRAPAPLRDDVRRAGSDVFDRIVGSVSDGIRKASQGRGKKRVPILDAVGGVIRGAVRASLGVGGSLVVGTKAVVMGVIRGVDERGDAALVILGHAARTVVRETSKARGDLRAAALGLVLGAVVSARAMGVLPSRAAYVARDAAVEEAGRIGSVAAEQVGGALKEDLGRTRVPTPSALPI